MAPYTGIALSPAELSYLHTSLSQHPPIRPDGRSPTTFRPLIAETDILPNANGSARICFADGTEAVVGVKAEVEKSGQRGGLQSTDVGSGDVDMGDEEDDEQSGTRGKGEESWLEVSIQIPDMRDDDALPVFLAAMLTEALLADGDVKDRLYINSRFHWRLYIDVRERLTIVPPAPKGYTDKILLLSQPLSYPLPLLSLTTHLALLSTRLPALLSQGDEDPLFNDDWDASTDLFSRHPTTKKATSKPPVTLLVMTVGSNILFDPSKEELAVADSVVAISAAQASDGSCKLVALRTVDPPSRLTAAGVPNAGNTNAGGSGLSAAEMAVLREKDAGATVWRPPRGGVARGVMSAMIKAVITKGGLADEVLAGLDKVET